MAFLFTSLDGVSSVCAQGSFCEKYFIWIPKERPQQKGSKHYCVHVYVITLSYLVYRPGETLTVLAAGPRSNPAPAHAKGSQTTNFPAPSISLPGTTQYLIWLLNTAGIAACPSMGSSQVKQYHVVQSFCQQ